MKNQSVSSRSGACPGTLLLVVSNPATNRLSDASSATMASFDFHAYLRSKCPYQTFDIEVVTGGLASLTVRARPIATALSSRYVNAGSIVLKYGPPFVPVLGRRMASSTERQASSRTEHTFNLERHLNDTRQGHTFHVLKLTPPA